MSKKMIIAALLTMSACGMCVAQTAKWSFENAYPVPKEQKSNHWSMVDFTDNVVTAYDFNAGKLDLIRLDRSGNVKAQTQTKKLPTKLLAVRRTDDVLNVILNNGGNIVRQTFDVQTLQPKQQEVLQPEGKEGKNITHNTAQLVWSPNGEYVGMLTLLDASEGVSGYKPGIRNHKLLLFDKHFKKLAEAPVDPHDNANDYQCYEADMVVSDKGEIIFTAFINETPNSRSITIKNLADAFTKTNIQEADNKSVLHVHRLSANGLQSYDMGVVAEGNFVVRPAILKHTDGHVLVSGFYGRLRGMYASWFAILDGFFTLDCDLTTKQAVEKGKLNFEEPWSCLFRYRVENFSPARTYHPAGAHVVSADKNPRDPYNRFEMHGWREYIWTADDGTNPVAGTWGSIQLKSANPAPLPIYLETGKGLAYFASGNSYYCIDIKNGKGTLRSVSITGTTATRGEAALDAIPNIDRETQFLRLSDGRLLTWQRLTEDKVLKERFGMIEP